MWITTRPLATGCFGHRLVATSVGSQLLTSMDKIWIGDEPHANRGKQSAPPFDQCNVETAGQFGDRGLRLQPTASRSRYPGEVVVGFTGDAAECAKPTANPVKPTANTTLARGGTYVLGRFTIDALASPRVRLGAGNSAPVCFGKPGSIRWQMSSIHAVDVAGIGASSTRRTVSSGSNWRRPCTCHRPRLRQCLEAFR
jgi:hypothetical protein